MVCSERKVLLAGGRTNSLRARWPLCSSNKNFGEFLGENRANRPGDDYFHGSHLLRPRMVAQYNRNLSPVTKPRVIPFLLSMQNAFRSFFFLCVWERILSFHVENWRFWAHRERTKTLCGCSPQNEGCAGEDLFGPENYESSCLGNFFYFFNHFAKL
jgi:hypothetical protein